MRSPDTGAQSGGKVPTLVIDGRSAYRGRCDPFYREAFSADASLLPRDDIEADAQALSWYVLAAATLPSRAPARTGSCHGGGVFADRSFGKRAGRWTAIRSPTSIFSDSIWRANSLKPAPETFSQSHRALHRA